MSDEDMDLDTSFEDAVDAIIGKLPNGEAPPHEAKFFAPLKIAEAELEAAVLEDETRVLSMSSVYKAFGRQKRGLSLERRKRAVVERDDGTVLEIPPFMAADNIISLIRKDMHPVLQPVIYSQGGITTSGYRAEILPEVCDLYLEARRLSLLVPHQQPIAARAEILLSAIAKVGIIALVDESTGFQKVRSSDALRVLVEQYIRNDARNWTKEFSNEFFRALDKAYGNKETTARKRPQYYGKFINTYIYAPIEKGKILEKLKWLHEVEPSKRMHQFLTDDRGLPVLRDRLSKVTGLLQAGKTIAKFKRLIGDMEDEQIWFDGLDDE